MTGDDTGHEASSRRDAIKYIGTVTGVGLLAGCSTDSDPISQSESDDTAVETTTEPTTEPSRQTSVPSWTVRMEPRTEVTFTGVPERVVVYRADYADMLIALGHGDALVGMQDTQSLPMDMLAELPDVSVDPSGITPLRQRGSYDKEVFYEIDGDLHLIDPNNAKHYFEFDEADITELSTNVAPWLGSFIRRPQSSIGPNYPHYSLYEAFEKVAQVFQASEKYGALSTVHDDLLTTIAERRPAAADRPSVGLAFLVPGDDFVGSGVFYLNDPTQPGMAMKQYRDLGVRNVWAEAGVSMEGQVDYETLLEADPDVLIAHNAFGSTDSIDDFQRRVVDVMRADDLGSTLTAVETDRVYRGGKNVQGPIINLFQTEIAAKQLYPEEFGDWRGLGDTPEDEQLFDRQAVADIVNGTV